MSRLEPAWRALLAVFLVLWLLLAAMLSPLTARAITPVTIPQGPLPVGDLKPVEFSFLTIDGTISATENGIGLETRTRLRLKNPQKKEAFERQVSFGAPVTDVKIGTQAQGVAPAQGSDPWLLSLPADGDAIIEGTYRLAASGPLVELQFNWESLRPWGWPLGAVRLTLHFPDDLDSEQLLAVEPAPTERDTVHLTWSYEKFKPSGRVRVFFITPPYWRALRSARQATSGDRASASSYIALANALRPLAEAEGMPPGRASALRDELLAALRQAVAADSAQARPHKELGIELQRRAAGDPGLLAEAAAELKAAYVLAPNDADLKAHLQATLEELIAACRKAGDTAGLLAALDLAESVDPRYNRERQAAYADSIVSLLEAGRRSEAEATIVAGFGRQALDRYASCRPLFSSVTGEVETQSGQRLIRFALAPAPGMEQAAERSVASLVEGMARVGNCQVQWAKDQGLFHIEVTVPFAEAQDLRAVGQALRATLPTGSDPALFLVAAAVGPADVDFQTIHGRWSDRLVYTERANLAPAQVSLKGRLEQLQAARTEVEGGTDDPAEAARRRWALALLKQYEADWQALTWRSEVTYRLQPGNEIAAPLWVLAWGEERTLSWSATIPRLARLRPYALGLGIGLVMLPAVFLTWRLWRRRSH